MISLEKLIELKVQRNDAVIQTNSIVHDRSDAHVELDILIS